MLQLFAQSTYNYNVSTEEQAGLAGLAIFGGFFLIIWLVVLVVGIVSLWKVFEKAGVEGWKAVVPFYNGYILAEISGKPGWWGIALPAASLIGWIPLIGWAAVIAAYVLYILIAIELSKKFGQEAWFAIILILFSVIGFAILGFGDAKYNGAKPAKTA